MGMSMKNQTLYIDRFSTERQSSGDGEMEMAPPPTEPNPAHAAAYLLKHRALRNMGAVMR